MSLAELADMPSGEAREWERLALDGPGPFQQTLLLAQILVAVMVGVGRGQGQVPSVTDFAPWLDGVWQAPEEVRARRAEMNRRRMGRTVARLAEEAYKRERDHVRH